MRARSSLSVRLQKIRCARDRGVAADLLERTTSRTARISAFVPDGDYAAAIERLAGIKAPCGNFIDASGKVIGTHRGITHYTVGQHRGLGLSLPERRYVCSIDAENSTVTLGGSDELYSSTAEVRGFNWISGRGPLRPNRSAAPPRSAIGSPSSLQQPSPAPTAA